jgi:GMP synthase-like glutamine amidotransferase
LSKAGQDDAIFGDLATPVCLFTHQDHVVGLPDQAVLLAGTSHNPLASVRIEDGQGGVLPVWGLQFHPEAVKDRIERSVRLGHISAEEAKAFEREHDGAAILANFAAEVAKISG